MSSQAPSHGAGSGSGLLTLLNSALSLLDQPMTEQPKPAESNDWCILAKDN